QYIHTLLAEIHGTNVLASATKDGFKLSVEMPVAIAESNSVIVKEDVEVNLKEAKFIIFTENEGLINNIESNIKNSNGNVERIKQIEHVLKQLSVKQLTANYISAIIVNSQELLKNERIIQQHLNSLPTKLRPKLVVLQPFFTHDLHRQGFYEWSDSPCEPVAFVEYLADFIQKENMSNLLIPSEVFSQFRFSQTQVEVLLAVECPEKYQNLSRLLYWLGLQVNIVCQAEMMLKQWQTGRYLVLLTEFNNSPFIDLQVGKNVNRGVFTLDKCQINPLDSKDSLNIQRWNQDKIINTLDIEHLVKLLSPWIKEKQVSLPIDRHEKPNKQATKVEKKKNKTLSADKKSVIINSDVPQAFDLAAYAKNQGSPELAVFMLDDYLAELNDAISAISVTLPAKKFDVAIESNTNILKITAILAAKDLNVSAKALEELLNKKALREANAKLKQIVSQFQALNEFTKTI
ncbi:MAG: hypothetical protein KC484_09380, partial [Colwelliaceae bacterium]|nr:hypothetical protein [Colwelliaceae bacterium]